MCHDNWSTKYMEGPSSQQNNHQIINKVKDNNTTLLIIKTKEGYPFEVYNLISYSIYMKFEGLRWPSDAGTKNEKAGTFRYNPTGTFLWCPRYVMSGDTWQTGAFYICEVTDCGSYQKRLNPSMTVTATYFANRDFVGDVGKKPCILLRFDFYGNGLYQKELYSYVKQYGLVKYAWYQYKEGQWVNVATKVFNLQKSGSYAEYCPCWPTQECK